MRCSQVRGWHFRCLRSEPASIDHEPRPTLRPRSTGGRSARTIPFMFTLKRRLNKNLSQQKYIIILWMDNKYLTRKQAEELHSSRENTTRDQEVDQVWMKQISMRVFLLWRILLFSASRCVYHFLQLIKCWALFVCLC